MTWVLWALAVAVLGGCVVVAVGRGGEMADAYDDRPDVLVPGDRPLGADDLRAVRFTTALRGYRMAEVDALVARLAAELDAAGSTGGDRAGGEDTRSGPGRPDATGFARRGEGEGRAG